MHNSQPEKFIPKTVKIQGKDYLQVAQRILWFRSEKPDWRIITEIVETDSEHTVMKASILNEKGETIATAHKYAGPERRMAKEYHRESAETGAVGRALGLLGYGTEAVFAADESSDFIADSPRHNTEHGSRPDKLNDFADTDSSSLPSPNWEIKFGKFKGQTIGDADEIALKDYCNYLVTNSKKTGEALSDFARELIAKTKEYYGTGKPSDL